MVEGVLRRTGRQILERGFINGVGAILGAIIAEAIAYVLTARPSVALLILSLAFFFLLFDLLLRWSRARWWMLVWSQRSLTVVVAALLLGAGAAMFAHTFKFELPESIVTASSLRRDLVSDMVLGGIAALAVLALLIRLNRLHVTAAQCHRVLKRLERERAFGEYTFVPRALGIEVRREARILDYLATHTPPRPHQRHWHLWPFMPARSVPPVVQRAWFGRYRLSVDGDILRDFCPSSSILSQAELPHSVDVGNADSTEVSSESEQSADRATETRRKEDEAYAERTECLGKFANAVWDDGMRRRLWFKTQGDTPSQVRADRLYVDKFFGNSLDQLFNAGAGFRAAGANTPKFVTIVIKGPPGAGKTTLALQQSVTVAKRGNICLYYSLEEERESLVQAAIDFGWNKPVRPEQNDVASDVDFKGVLHDRFEILSSRIAAVKEQERTRPRKYLRRSIDSAESGNSTGQCFVGAVLISSLGHSAMTIAQRRRQLYVEWDDLPEALPQCVVIDSLEGFANVGANATRHSAIPRDELLALKDFFRDRCEILVLLVEDDGSGTPDYVEFVADVVIQLTARTENGYTTHYAQIHKARNQSHALGEHQIKIRSVLDLNALKDVASDVLSNPRGLLPGMQVIPSLYYRLSQAQHQQIADEVGLNTGLSGLDTMLFSDRASGMRRKSTTVLLGPTSTGKSLIAMNFLIEGVRENTRTLLLSLHDDEVTIRNRGVPQEPGRIQFSWDREHENTFQRFTWDLNGIAEWSARATSGSSARLPQMPYLFKESADSASGTSSRTAEHSSQHASERSVALDHFFSQLAEACPPVRADGFRCWDAAARRHLAEVYEAAWLELIQAVGHALEVVEDARQPGRVVPKQLQLVNEDGTPDQPPPALTWDSRRWDGKTIFDTSLLNVKYLRPGNITPEDFIDLLIREIGEPNVSSRYGRVVFDDVDQLRQRVPLLARSPLFLPTVIDMFKATGVTAMFVAGPLDGPDQETSYGLSLLADHAIHTSVRFYPDLAKETPLPEPLPAARIEPLPAGAKLYPRGDPAHRIIVVEIAGRPGSERLGPSRLRVSLKQKIDPHS